MALSESILPPFLFGVRHSLGSVIRYCHLLYLSCKELSVAAVVTPDSVLSELQLTSRVEADDWSLQL